MDSKSFLTVCYKQLLDTCVLASYAVASFPFVKVPVLDFFVAYCCDHGLSHDHPERSYDDEFHSWPHGYGVIWKLHHESTVALFEKCRRAILLEDLGKASVSEVEERLQACQESTLMLFINKSKRELDLKLASMHSIAVGYSSSSKFFYYDTGNGKVFENISSLTELGECGDRFLLSRKC
jgi:hypothetical protein